MRQPSSLIDRGAGEASILFDLAGFRFAIRQFLNFSDTISRAAGVTSQQYQAMLVIHSFEGGEVTVKDIAEQMVLRPNGAVQLVNRMEMASLVTRRKLAADGRKVSVSLTAKGKRTLEKLAAEHVAELRRHEPLLAESLSRLRNMRSR